MSYPIQVPPSGPLNAKIALIGEAPGANEARIGKPFVGKAGKILEVLLASIGYSKEECYITNVVKQRPENNQISQFIQFNSRGSLSSTTAAFDWYRENLLEELEACEANVLVPLGNVPLYALTGIEKPAITKRHGGIYKGVNGRKVIPTLHPAALLPRQNYHPPPKYRDFILKDLKRIALEAQTSDLNLPEPNLILSPSFLEVMEYLDHCAASKVVAFDIEGVESVNLISFCYNKDSAISIPFFNGKEDGYKIEEETAIWKQIAKICEAPSITKVGHNIIYDSAVIHRLYGIITAPVDDSMVAMAIAYPDFEKKLENVTWQFTRLPYYKDEGHDWMKQEKGSFEAFSRYNALDALVPFLAMPLLKRDLKRQHNLEAYKRQVSQIEPLMFMQARGLRFDTERVKKRSLAAQRLCNTLIKRFRNYTKEPTINIGSPKQVANYLYIKKGYPVQKHKGKISTNEECLKRLQRGTQQRAPIIEAKMILDYRHFKKERGTYLEMLPDPLDNRLRGSLNPAGTRSGRLSCSKWLFKYGGNLQTLPYSIKRFVLPDKGYYLFNVDLSQAENRIVAWIAPEFTMMSAFKKGEDIHKKTAALLLNKDIDEISSEPGSSPLGTGTRSERYFGKEANHALNYGLGPVKFANRLEVTIAEAKQLRNRYFIIYPGVLKYQAWVRNKISREHFLENCCSRRQYFRGSLRDDELEKMYYFIPQSTVADHLNTNGLHYLYYDVPASYGKLELLLPVHDSLLFQIPKSTSFELIYKMLNNLKLALETPIPWQGSTFVIPAAFSLGKNYQKMTEFGKKVGALKKGELREVLKGVK